MFRGFLKVAAVGAAGFVAWRMLWVFVFPFVFGFFGLMLKLAFWAAVVAFLIWLFRRLTRPTLTVSS